MMLHNDDGGATLVSMSNAPKPCTCRGYDPTDPCGHADTSEGCPRHDPNFDQDDA